MTIQWFPGHMAKARRKVQEHLKMVDVVLELLDARIPASSRNPMLCEIIGDKPSLIILNKSDLADPDSTAAWQNHYKARKVISIAVEAVHGKGVNKIPPAVNELAAVRMQSARFNVRHARPARCMVLGIPNVGKSALINRLSRQKVAKTGDKPGVTRGPQWIRLAQNLELLDTPGILWPKFEDHEVAFRLAVTGAIKEDVFNLDEVVLGLITWLRDYNPDALVSRYRLDSVPDDPIRCLYLVGTNRGYYITGGQVDLHKAAVNVLKEFREGKLGRYTLELPKQQVKNT